MGSKKSAPTQKQSKMMQAAIQLHQSGQLELAQSHYQRLIGEMPNNAVLLTNLAIIKLHQGKLEEAVTLINRSLAVNPNQPDILNHQGSALKALGRLEDALTAFNRLIALQPKSIHAHSNRGNVLQALKQFEEAIKSYDHAIALKYDFLEAHYNRGSAFDELKHYPQAIESYSRAIAINPNFFQGYCNRGNALHHAGKLQEALQDYNRAIALNPKYAQAHYNRGNLLQQLGQWEEALESYDHAIALMPKFIEAHFNRANLLKSLKRTSEALVGYDTVINLQASHVDAHYNRGNALKDIGLLEAATQSYQRVIALNPLHGNAYHNYGNALKSLKKPLEALEKYKRALEINPDIDFLASMSLLTQLENGIWHAIDANLESLVTKAKEGKKALLPFSALALLDDSSLHKQVADIYATLYSKKESEMRAVSPPIAIHPQHDKIRIGYFSADFNNHPVAYLTAELYEIHNRDMFEIHAFSLSADTDDEMNLRIKAGVDHFHHLHNLTDIQAASLARSLQIDIAVDLGGYTQKARTGIFALKAAPVQVGYIGYPGTMGADYFHYLIADEILIPKEMQAHYVEKIAYLPCWQVNDSTKQLPTTAVTRQQFGLPETGFVFCCFNNSFKITPDVFNAWARILQAVQGSVLFLYAGSDIAKDNLKHEMSLRGIDPSRLIFGERLELQAYLARYKAADLFLDTFPYNAGTTASDALQMGLPLVAFKGKSFVSNGGASVLHSANLPELICTNQSQYEALAIELATNPAKLKAIKDKIANHLLSSPLYDSQTFVRNIESLYQQMHSKAINGKAPDHLYIQQ